jgi:hypothetical protein
MITSSNAQQQRESAVKPMGYQFTVNAKDAGIEYNHSYLIGDIKKFLSIYDLPDSSNIKQEAIDALDRIDAWMTSLAPKMQGLKIDVIGQTHLVYSPIYSNQTYQSELLESQGKIKDILLANKYDVVGAEGSALKLITRETLKKGEYGVRVRNGAIRDKSYLAAGPSSQQEYLTRNAIDGLLLTSPNFTSTVTGTEDTTIHYLQGLTIEAQLSAFNPYYGLNELLTNLRSYIAFFKVGEAMLETKAKTGVSVIGALHLQDFWYLARALGTNTDFYYTSRGSMFASPFSQ